jgi:hypothetical protein
LLRRGPIGAARIPVKRCGHARTREFLTEVPMSMELVLIIVVVVLLFGGGGYWGRGRGYW